MNAYTEIQKLAGWIKSADQFGSEGALTEIIIANIRKLDYKADLTLFETRSSVDVRSAIEG